MLNRSNYNKNKIGHGIYGMRFENYVSRTINNEIDYMESCYIEDECNSNVKLYFTACNRHVDCSYPSYTYVHIYISAFQIRK